MDTFFKKEKSYINDIQFDITFGTILAASVLNNIYI